MYKAERQQLAFSDFNQPVGLNLDPENRWIKMSRLTPWETMEKKCAKLCPAHVGYPAKPFRLVMGALIIQKLYDCTDRELIQMIRENPYLQFFCGYPGYDSSRNPFNASALVGFQKRLTPEILSCFNNMIIDLDKGVMSMDTEPDRDKDDTDDGEGPGNTGTPAGGENQATDSSVPSDCSETPQDSENAVQTEGSTDSRFADSKDTSDVSPSAEQQNSGTLILDATCAPSNIRYPQNTSLLNEARKKAESLIDRLHARTGGRKPRTYRVKA